MRQSGIDLDIAEISPTLDNQRIDKIVECG